MELILLFLLLFTIGAVIYGCVYLSWIPCKIKFFRIKEKYVGDDEEVLYRSEFYRPYLGWVGFWTNDSGDKIVFDSEYSTDKKKCENFIKILNKSKND